MPEPLVKLTIDDQVATVPAGTNIIEAAKSVGIEVPHYCYHPKLTIAGNCRMCLVEVGLPERGADNKPTFGADGKPHVYFLPRLQIGCNTPVVEGMVVRTRTPKVIKARQGVMEFLLINHPLDCPICDQAGECRLQEFSEDYGKGVSRFVEDKVHKPKRVPLGPKIVLDAERCILCSRCERFMREIAGQDVLGFVKRGSETELTIYPGEFPNTNYDLNIVDICPVGALTSVDFRFTQRPWFLKETASVCPHCATGCNTVLWSREGMVYRQTPRDNNAVNQCWMCDYGRLNYKFINDPNRLQAPLRRNRGTGQVEPLAWRTAAEEVASTLRQMKDRGADTLAAIGSARSTNEELFLFRKLACDLLGITRIDCAPRTGPADNLLLNADRNPNSRGAKLMQVAAEPPGGRIPEIARGIEEGRIKGLIVLGENVIRCGIPDSVLAKLELLVAIDILPNPVIQRADYVLPGASFAEKRGTWINKNGRLQRINPAMPPPGLALPEWQILSFLVRELMPSWKYMAVEEIFLEMARTIPPLAGLTLAKIGNQGALLNLGG